VPALPRAVLERAEARAGTVSRRALIRLGFARQELDYWLAIGLIERTGHGEYRVAGSERSIAQALWSVVARAGDGARLAGPIVLGLRGIKGFAHLARDLDARLLGPGPVGELDHVAVPTGRRVRGVEFRVVRTPMPAEDRDEVLGVPAVTVARALVGAARTEHPARIRSAFDDARFKGLVTEPEVVTTTARLGLGYGAAQMRRILRTGALQHESEAERDLLSIFRPGDPVPEPQVWVRWHERYFRLDFAYLAGRVDLEYDGGNHGRRREEDAERDLAIAELRIHPLRITRKMMRDPEGTRRRILAVVEQRRALDLPPIVPEPPPWVTAGRSGG
jgi:hypothetical protein